MGKNLLRYVMAASLVLMTGYSMADLSSSIKAPAGAFIQNNPNGTQTLLGHVPAAVAVSTKRSPINLNQTLDLRVTLPIRNEPQLDAALKGLYDPKSPSFGRFLTPEQFAQQYGAAQADMTQIKDFLKLQGLTVTGQSSNGLVLNVSGTAANVQRAFGVIINNYQKADGGMFFAPETGPTIPLQLFGKINAVGGLDNAIKFEPHFHQVTSTVSAPAGISQGWTATQKPQTVSPKLGTGPGGYLAPKDVTTAYNLTTIPSNGAGQTIALFELDGYLAKDITAYEAAFQLPNVPLQNVLIDGCE